MKDDIINQPELEKVTIDIAVIEKLREEMGLNRFPEARFSTYFILLLWQIQVTRSVHIHSIISEIETLESGGDAAFTKTSQPLTGPYLHGLRHKHFTDARFLPKNIDNELNRNGSLRKALSEFVENPSEQQARQELSEKIHQMVISAVENRGHENRMTGEWILYVRHQGHNHYLTISTHKIAGLTPDEHDKALRAEILSNCGWEFPFLFDILGTKSESENP